MMTDTLVFSCPHCREPIGSIRPYTGKRAGRPEGAIDTAPRKERAGDLNKAIAAAAVQRTLGHDAQCEGDACGCEQRNPTRQTYANDIK
jgi:hypothetical protein